MKYLSIDAGGTLIKYAWLNEDGEVLEMGTQPTPYTTKEDFMAVITSIWHMESGIKGGLCISLPGTIDSTTGYVYQGGSLRYHHGVNIKQLYEQELNTLVEVENDARCAAIAEQISGNMQGITNGIVLTFGTGVGGCFIINHDIYRGTHLFSGEVSMLLCDDMKTKGLDAVYGNIGGINELVKRICKQKKVAVTDGKTVFKWIANGDNIACQIFQRYCDTVVLQFYNMQIMLDPERLCIGGGVSENPIFIEGLKQAMHRFYESFPITIPRLEILPCRYHNNANLIGAFYHFKKTNKSILTKHVMS